MRPLMQLKLGSNKLSELPAELFDELPEMLYLNVFNNKLKSLPASLGRCTKMQRLNVAYNQLKSLPKEIAALKSLQYCVLSGNRFDKLPRELCALPLKELYASCNNLTELPAELAQLAGSLSVLDCVANKLAVLPDAVCQLAALHELEVGHNALTRLPTRLGASLKHLINLDVSDNPGLQLDAELIESLQSVTQLKLGYCLLNAFPPVTALPPDLALISLEGNRIKYDEMSELVQSHTELCEHSSHDRSYFDVSWAEMRGMRPTQEDTVVLHTNAVKHLDWKHTNDKAFAKAVAKGRHTRDMGICAVFDGHRGAGAAEYAAKHMVPMLYDQCAAHPVEKAIKQTFNQLSNDIVEQNIESGTTALVTVVIGDDLYVSNCGDARAVLCRDGNAVRLSVDHKPDDPLERKRIRELGGYVSYTGRILDDILVARSLGDAQNQPYVTSEPYVAHFELTDKDEFLILACDGVWDVVSDEAAVELVREYAKKSLASPAVALRDHAFSAGSTDNLSCVIVFLSTNSTNFDDKDPTGAAGAAGAAADDDAAADDADDADEGAAKKKTKKKKAKK
eukprot:TRINITY_DN813_c0_g3_i1.p1 TRINITY_DN813_c0_g3~~TRINITY_DN813_c0_g3_i1.p1  ORF type:complete len:565 (+),score=412.98 TRINITY_DN813_c0_g3_i1:154-1848(+)